MYCNKERLALDVLMMIVSLNKRYFFNSNYINPLLQRLKKLKIYKEVHDEIMKDWLRDLDGYKLGPYRFRVEDELVIVE